MIELDTWHLARATAQSVTLGYLPDKFRLVGLNICAGLPVDNLKRRYVALKIEPANKLDCAATLTD